MKKKFTKIIAIALCLCFSTLIFSACGDNASKIYFFSGTQIVGTIKTNGNQTITLPEAPNKDGYNFEGWYFDKGTWENELTPNYYANKPLTTNVTVYAYYVENQVAPTEYTITFMVDGEEFDTILTAGNEAITLPIAPIKTNYEFNGWYFDEGTWQNELTENTYINTPLNRNETVYAYYVENQVTPTEYIITFMVDGEEFDTILTAGNEAITLPIAPIKTNYEFNGWYFDEGTWQNELTENTYINTPLNRNETVYAYYVENQVTPTEFTVNFETNGGTNIASIKTNIIQTSPETTRQNFDFVGWYLESTFINKVEFPFNVTRNLTLYAKWSEKIEDVVYSVTDGYITGIESAPQGELRLSLPEYIDGVKILGLEQGAFMNNTNLVSVVIPDSYQSVAYQCFKNCSNLSYVKLPANLTVISPEVFENCALLKEIDIPDGVVEIRSDAFYNSGLTAISLPDSTIDIWQMAFYGCTNLKSANLNKVESLGNMVFYNCSSLTEIVLPDTIKEVDRDLFANCTSLAKITLPDNPIPMIYSAFHNTAYYNNDENWENNVLYIGKYLICAKNTINNSMLQIKNGTTVIADYAFSSCHSPITKIVLPEGLKIIGENAFRGLTQLGEINIPNSVEILGEDAFYNTLITSDTSSYWENNGLYLGQFLVAVKDVKITTFEVKEGTKYIADGKLFSSKNARYVTEIILPDSLEYIGKNNFESTNIQSIILPSNLKTIAYKAFYNCSNLITVDTSNCISLNKLCYSAFAGCNITEINIPETVEFMDEFIFNHNKNIVINCGVSAKPDGWHNDWSKNYSGIVTVNWKVI